MADFAENNKRKPKIIWFINIPSPYRVDFFEKLGKVVNLFVIFEKGRSDERDNSWNCQEFKNFKAIILNGIRIRTDSAFDVHILKYLKTCKEFDFIMISNPLTPTGMFVIQYLKMSNIPFYIETDGGFPKSGKEFTEIIKRKCISPAKAWFSTADIHDSYYLKYGAKETGLIRYPFSSISERDVLDKPTDQSEKSILRESLGISQNKVILGVGQFIRRKGFDILLEIAGEFGNDTAVVLLGGEKNSEYDEIIRRLDIHNVYFPGFITKNRISNYYLAADIFVLPTREDIWGLVINEAAAYGLPIVTTTMCIAGTELVKQGVNGYLVEPEDREGLRCAIQGILADTKLQRSMCLESLKIAREYTIENMVRVHESIFISR